MRIVAHVDMDAFYAAVEAQGFFSSSGLFEAVPHTPNVAINLFNIDRMKFVERAPVKHQCSRDYFYGRIPLWRKLFRPKRVCMPQLREIF